MKTWPGGLLKMVLVDANFIRFLMTPRIKFRLSRLQHKQNIELLSAAKKGWVVKDFVSNKRRVLVTRRKKKKKTENGKSFDSWTILPISDTFDNMVSTFLIDCSSVQFGTWYLKKVQT